MVLLDAALEVAAQRAVGVFYLFYAGYESLVDLRQLLKLPPQLLDD